MKKAITLIIFLALSLISAAQNYFDVFSDAVCTVEFYDSSKRPVEKHTATGTLFMVDIDSSHQALLIVTNRHALPKLGIAKQIFIKTHVMSEKDSLLRYGKGIPFDVYDENYKLSKHILFAQDEVDIAIINFSATANSHKIGGNTLNIDFLATNDTIKKYQIGIVKMYSFWGIRIFTMIKGIPRQYSEVA